MVRREQTNTMLRTSEVAWLFDVNSNTVRRWADRGIIRAYRIGRRGYRRFKREDVAHLLADRGA